ncbi:hypothetical protein HZS_7429 [Henneguya salminicola]|nr:hypothetical protein HZS_7429 [Henneguya salminicola]
MSSSVQISRNYTINLNNNFKNIILQYLQSRKLKSDVKGNAMGIDGEYDVYLKKTKTFVNDLDVCMLNFESEVDENNQLEVEIVFYDLSRFSETKEEDETSLDADVHSTLFTLRHVIGLL